MAAAAKRQDRLSVEVDLPAPGGSRRHTVTSLWDAGTFVLVSSAVLRSWGSLMNFLARQYSLGGFQVAEWQLSLSDRVRCSLMRKGGISAIMESHETGFGLRRPEFGLPLWLVHPGDTGQVRASVSTLSKSSTYKLWSLHTWEIAANADRAVSGFRLSLVPHHLRLQDRLPEGSWLLPVNVFATLDEVAWLCLTAALLEIGLIISCSWSN